MVCLGLGHSLDNVLKGMFSLLNIEHVFLKNVALASLQEQVPAVSVLLRRALHR